MAEAHFILVVMIIPNNSYFFVKQKYSIWPVNRPNYLRFFTYFFFGVTQNNNKMQKCKNRNRNTNAKNDAPHSHTNTPPHFCTPTTNK